MKILAAVLIVLVSASAQAESGWVEAKRVQALGVNIACVAKNGLAFGIVYRSKGLPRPQVFVGIDLAENFGPQTTLQETFPGQIKINIPEDYNYLPESDIVGHDAQGFRIAKTTAQIGYEKDVPCVYVMTPGTLKALKFQRSGIQLE